MVKLLDFGLVHQVETPADDKVTQVGMILGTPAYMSPEQAKNATDLGPASDLYSLGATAYFLVTGVPPFQGQSAMETLMANYSGAMKRPRELRPDVPEDLEAVIMRCLAKDASQRYHSANELQAALDACSNAHDWRQVDAAEWWKQRSLREL